MYALTHSRAAIGFAVKGSFTAPTARPAGLETRGEGGRREERRGLARRGVRMLRACGWLGMAVPWGPHGRLGHDSEGDTTPQRHDSCGASFEVNGEGPLLRSHTPSLTLRAPSQHSAFEALLSR